MTRSPHSVEFEALRLKTGLSRSEAANLLGVTERTVIRYENGDSRPSPIAIKWLQEHLARLPEKRLKPAAFRFIDLFAGIGGLRIGFDAIGGQCVFTSEWDKYSQATYRENFGNDHPIAGDIREYSKDPSMIPAHDVLLAGFPCQPFSIAGVSKKNALGRPHGFLCDTQGTLFFDLAQIIAHHQPSAFLLENVKNLQRHDKGRTFATIINVLRNELGYEIHHRVINSAPWVPQKRERIFIVGFKKESSFDFDRLVVPENSPKLGRRHVQISGARRSTAIERSIAKPLLPSRKPAGVVASFGNAASRDVGLFPSTRSWTDVQVGFAQIDLQPSCAGHRKDETGISLRVFHRSCRQDTGRDRGRTGSRRSIS
ncbi:MULTISPECIES: DNA (cytosine-5-)-methyltransferase [unclassified Bradyrhizobium]|uniref:DNA (cytosine-5-)-methyltransferase n=1 Tax=unclassified Bradyrhizobium TaxID=2631580 RepID=UPI00036ED71A|nr:MULTISPECIES: DNA (cytosine-5-)-methyltransferase [unclassified Bradyrhizobium]